MSQRNSGYERVPCEAYYTPEWVVNCLIPHIPPTITHIHEPAAGGDAIVKALSLGFRVTRGDLTEGYDFLKDPEHYPAIVTNPPYDQACEFIEAALMRAEFIAMLLRTDYDHAMRRAHLFDHPKFSREIKLRKRIVWDNLQREGAAPSFWHTWFIWRMDHHGPATITYAR